MNKITDFIFSKTTNSEPGILNKICGIFSKITSFVAQFFENKNQKSNPDPKVSSLKLADKVSLEPKKLTTSHNVMAGWLRQICAVAHSPKKKKVQFPDQVSWQVFEGVHRDNPKPLSFYEREEIIARQILKLEKKHPRELLYRLFDKEGFMLMDGVALVASYLRHKKNLQNLYVCTSFEAFQIQLNKISQLKEGRFAFILPSGIENRQKKDKDYKGDAGHKISVCVEKTSEGVNIAILDALGWKVDEDDYHLLAPHLLHKSAKENQYTDIAGREIFWYIIHSHLYSPTTTIYFSSVERQHAGFGCETFSLRDAVWFLQERDFFNKIQCDDVLVQERNVSLHLKPITLLPPIFMKSAQSKRLITSYRENYIKVFPGSQTELDALQKSLPKHESENQNHYINHRSDKYHFLALTALLDLNTQEVEKFIKEAGLIAPCPPIVQGQAPQTLSERNLFPSSTVTITRSRL